MSPAQLPPESNAIRAERSRARLTQHELAQRAGLTPGFIHRVEAGKVSPRIEDLRRIATALGVPLSSIVTSQQIAA
jgi:transcriptional regulator with XRE-family HTH domain